MNLRSFAAVLALLLAGPAVAQNQNNVTPIDCSGAIATNNVAKNAFNNQGNLRGFTIKNENTSEQLCISFTGTAACGSAGTYSLQPGSATVNGGSFTTPPGLGTNHALSVVAATAGHVYSCTFW